MKLALIGCGLIGTSFAAALKKAGVALEVVAYNRHIERAQKAMLLGYVDCVASSVADAVAEADAVLLAVPVRAMPSFFKEIAAHAKAGATISDVGSVRGSVVEVARDALGDFYPSYVPVHPIAGSEKTGVDAANAQLFVNTVAVSTPLPGQDEKALAFWEDLWRKAGSRVVRMGAARHDETLAAVSHLPHIVAFSLMRAVQHMDKGEEKLAFAGPGFKDTTRIAAASPVMWRDIALTNKEALLKTLAAFEKELALFRDLIEKEDGAGLEDQMSASSQARRALK